ncbi:MAG: helix-turn-helix domain-containing protein [Archangium sp.]|nr:helix-turn-helix domain-containing protein [Archangium sp.]
MIPQPTPTDGRVLRRLEAMRRAQDAALDLFEARGFDAVTVDDVARAAGVGVASLFRNFGTKEQLVLWDEYDPLLFEAVAAHLETKPPLEAMSAGVRDALGSVYEKDRRRVLRRAELMAKTPALRLAGLANLQALRAGLNEVLAPKVKDPLERELLGAVFGATLEVSVERWRKERARRPLAVILREAFKGVARLG